MKKETFKTYQTETKFQKEDIDGFYVRKTAEKNKNIYVASSGVQEIASTEKSRMLLVKKKFVI